jgi:hypothetical protein
MQNWHFLHKANNRTKLVFTNWLVTDFFHNQWVGNIFFKWVLVGLSILKIEKKLGVN